MYFKELKIISSKEFSKKIIKNITTQKIKKKWINDIKFNYHSVKIFFPKKEFIKKFKLFGVIHKTNFKPINFKPIIFLKDQDIIN